MQIFRYVMTLKNYLQTAKGRHDFFDYLRAGIIILATALLIGLIFGLR